MGLGVRFISPGGEERSAQLSSPDAVSGFVKDIVGTAQGNMASAADLAKEAFAMRGQQPKTQESGKVKSLPHDKMEYLSEKLKANGSIGMTQEGRLCLKGEEQSTPNDKTMYSNVGGIRMFRTIKDLDPADSCKLIGNAFGDTGDDENTETRSDDDSGGWGFWVQTRSKFKVEQREVETEGAGSVTHNFLMLYTYYREVRFSANGRCLGLSAECRVIGEPVDITALTDLNMKYCAKLNMLNGVASGIMFGTYQQLESDSGNVIAFTTCVGSNGLNL